MIGPSFKINGESLDFYLNTKTKQWHIGKSYTNPILKLSKARGDNVIQFLKVMQEHFGSNDLEIKKASITPYKLP